jgi:hypothetical protein
MSSSTHPRPRGARPREIVGGSLAALPALATAWCVLALVCLLGVTLPAAASAFAAVGTAPLAGAPGLPDGRVYEQVSPPNKHGNAAAPPIGLQPPAMLAEPDGQGVSYTVNGTAIGEAQSAAQGYTIAQHAGQGWVNNGATPRSIGEQSLLQDHPERIGFSTDLTKVIFGSQADYATLTSPEPTPFDAALRYDVTTGTTAWLDPMRTDDLGPESLIAGFSADMSTVFLQTESGLYEWHEGVLSPASVLPDGSFDPNAVSAGLPSLLVRNESEAKNQVSSDGTRAFFVSSLGGSGAPELYVRERAGDGSESTVLVSRDTTQAPVNGLPAAAPRGVVELSFPGESVLGEELSGQAPGANQGFMYASPDGSHVFFASEDQLTGDAPSGGGMYQFDTLDDTLSYLPGVGASPIMVSSQDGSRFIFDSPSGLSLWSEGQGGGTVTPIVPNTIAGEARSTPDGSVFVFETAAPISGFNNGGSHFIEDGSGPFRNQEIYRYDVAAASLSCVSCPPAGVLPSGNAYLSHDVQSQTTAGAVFMPSRGISEDGSRVFFDTPDPLVPQDTNTAPLRSTEEGAQELGRDVYEWEDGRDFLISTGTSSRDAYIGDASADGSDVFFATAQGITAGDTDEGYDVYDARVPRPGDRPPPPAAPCQGDVCQGPPSVPDLLSAPASATFNGLGNTPPPAVKPAATVKAKAVAKKCKKGFTLKRGKCVKAQPKRKTSSHSKKGKK